jgi:SAM-dependent methyltransferase
MDRPIIIASATIEREMESIPSRKSTEQDCEFDVRTFEERLRERSDRLEDKHMAAAIDAQLIDVSSAANLTAVPTEGRDKDRAIFDDYVNPDAVENCLSPYVPTAADRIAAFVSFAGLNRDDVLLDIGCGDGRVCIAAVKLTGCRAVGLDVSPLCIRVARSVGADEGLVGENQCVFLEADATIDPNIFLSKQPMLSNLLQSVTVVFLFTYPTLLKKLVPLLERLMEQEKVSKVVTLTYHLPDDVVTVGRLDEKNDFRLYTRIASQLRRS